MIILTCEKAREEDLKLENYFQNSKDRIREFFSGSYEEFDNFLKLHHLELRENYQNIDELINDNQVFLENLKIVFEKDLGSFDLDFVNALLKTQNSLSQEFLFTVFDLSAYEEEKRKEIFKLFYELSSVSLIDFRAFEADFSKLYFIYNRRGFFREGQNIVFKLTKNILSLQIGKEDIKYYNYILADFIRKIAEKIPALSFAYKYSNGKTEFLNKMTSEEILNGAKILKAKIQAKNEINKENSSRRGSLKAESFHEALSKEASTELRQNSSLEESIELYKAKEKEKFDLRLDLAVKDFQKCYEYILSLLKKELGILEAFNVARQKFSSEHTLNLASILLTKDVVDIQLFKEQILLLKKEKESLEEALEEKNKILAFQEQTLATLKENLLNLRKSCEKEKNDLKNFHLQDVKKFNEELEFLKEEFLKRNEEIEEKNIFLREKDEALENLQANVNLMNEKNFLKDELILSLKAQLEYFKNKNDDEIEF